MDYKDRKNNNFENDQKLHSFNRTEWAPAHSKPPGGLWEAQGLSRAAREASWSPGRPAAQLQGLEQSSSGWQVSGLFGGRLLRLRGWLGLRGRRLKACPDCRAAGLNSAQTLSPGHFCIGGFKNTCERHGTWSPKTKNFQNHAVWVL